MPLSSSDARRVDELMQDARDRVLAVESMPIRDNDLALYQAVSGLMRLCEAQQAMIDALLGTVEVVQNRIAGLNREVAGGSPYEF